MELLRRKTDYAVRMMTKLSVEQERGWISTKDLAEAEDVSYPLAGKLMQKLQKSSYIGSCQGRSGGFELTKDPDKISLLEIIETIQGPLALNTCLLGNHKCDREKSCALHEKLRSLQEYITQYLADISLADLANTTGNTQTK